MARHFTYLFTIFLILYSGTVQSQQNQQQQQQQNRPPQQGQQQQQQQNRPPQQGQQQQQNRPPQQGQQPQQGQNVARPMNCLKMEFNRPSNPEFPEFVTKQYRPGTQPPPYRPQAKNYLSANVNDFTFGMSKTKFTLNPNSHIEAAVFFHAPAGGPFFDIIVYDVTTNQQEILHVTGTKGWNILRKNITKNIQNARIKMNVNNLTPQCILAIEYVHILNRGIRSPDCTPTPPPPPPTTKPPQTTRKPGGPGGQTTTKRPTVTVKPNPQQVWLWAITATCLCILLILCTMIGIYCMIERRKRSKNIAT